MTQRCYGTFFHANGMPVNKRVEKRTKSIDPVSCCKHARKRVSSRQGLFRSSFMRFSYLTGVIASAQLVKQPDHEHLEKPKEEAFEICR